MTPSAAMRATAADWLARHDQGLDTEAQRGLQAWLGADPRHLAAWREIAIAWSAFDRPRQRGESDDLIRELEARHGRRLRRRRRLSAAGALAVLAVAGVLWLGPMRSIPGAATSPGLVRSVPERRELADGSVVELKAGAEIAVQFTADRRDVRLLAGEAHFQVAKNPARPFIVTTAEATVRAVGTAFVVGWGEQAVDVLVDEGTVAVARPSVQMSSALAVAAGQVVAVPRTAGSAAPLRVEIMSAAEMERRTEWRFPRLELNQARLADVVAALNRENALQLALDDAELAEMRLNGAVRADRAEDFVRLLETHYGVQVERPAPGAVVLRLRRAK